MNQKIIDVINEISKILFKNKINYELLITKDLIQVKNDSFTIFIRKEKKDKYYDLIKTNDLSLATYTESEVFLNQLNQLILGY